MNYQHTPEQAKCPVCSHHEGSLYWTVNSQEAAAHFVLETAARDRFEKLKAHIETLWQGPTCKVIECRSCRFVYASPYVAGDKTFYELAYERSGYPGWKWEYRKTLDTLQPLITPEFTLLEVGAGNGAFIRALLPLEVQAKNMVATEYSDYGRTSIEQMGIQCLPEDVRSLDKNQYGKRFDAICLFQVLEHLDNLDPLFVQLKTLLKTGGSLFIAVPNNARIEFNEQNGALLDMPPNHIGRWNRSCFEVIARNHGFTLAEHAVEEFKRLPALYQFAVYRTMKNAQRNGSLENLAFSLKGRLPKAIAIRIMAVVNLMKGLPAILKMNSTLGDSQWAHFKSN